MRQAMPFQVVGTIDVLQQLQPFLGRALGLMSQQFLQVIEPHADVTDPLREPIVVLQGNDGSPNRLLDLFTLAPQDRRLRLGTSDALDVAARFGQVMK